MGRLIALLLGVAALAFAAKYALTSGSANLAPPQVETGIKPVDANGEHTRPKQQLDNVRERAHELEKDDQKRVDDALKNTEAQ